MNNIEKCSFFGNTLFMPRITLALIASLSVSNYCLAGSNGPTPEAAKESVCKVVVAELYKFGMMTEPGIELLKPDPGKSKNFALINPDFIKAIKDSSIIYKNLDCDKVLKQ